VAKRRALCSWTHRGCLGARPNGAWALLALAALASAGCQRQAPLDFVSAEQVRQLEAPLQEAVRGQLARLCGTHAAPELLGAGSADTADLQLGQQVYERYCQQCHGVSGDGAGPAAAYLDPRPRDYRRGIFKFTSTPYGNKPRREDLVRTVTRGIPGTSMPSFARLPKRELEAVIDYVLALTHRGELEQLLAAQAEAEGELDPEAVESLADNIVAQWRAADDNLVEPASRMPPLTAESIAQGAEILQKRECFKCHGRNGRGGLAGGIEVGLDAWGRKTAAADLTSGMLHGGQQPLDVYRRIYAGINGTPMPAFKDALAESPDDVWHLAHYVLDLADQRRRGARIPPAAPPAPAESQPADSETTP
jgi:mono/diheme cytochrome c family protein